MDDDVTDVETKRRRKDPAAITREVQDSDSEA